TGGSTLMRMYEAPVRESAAIARALLCMAAAQQWDAAWEDCDTQDGFVTLGQRRLRFGDLAAAAADMRPPSYPPVRALASGALFGQSPPRLDLPAKMDGNFPFAGDVRLPDLAYAAIRQGPIGDTRLISHDIAAATQVSGFLHAVTHDRWLAAVGTNSWAAQRALDAMAPVFRTTGPRADSDDIDRALASAVRAANGVRVVDEGDVAAAFDGRPVLGADYVVAPMQHVPMETRAATASVVDGHARLWVASQAPGACRAAVAAALGLAVERVTLFPMAAGGNSGVAMNHDVAVQAALIARATNRPIALMWSRTEEILRDLPRAPVRAAMRATLSSGASIDGWQASIAAPASRHEWRARVDGAKADVAMRGAAGRADAAMVAGARPPYIIPHCAVDHLPVDTGLPTGYVRGLADGYTAFFNEAFVDELAAIAGTDPFGFRMSMLAQQPDLARCLQTATALGGWLGGQSGSGQGLACHSMRGSHIAVMAVARPTGAGIAVERLIAAVDVGRVMNPDLVKQQIEGGLIFGLAGAVGATTRYAGGMARARRMGDMGLPTLAQSPEIVVEIIASNRDPGGHEELGMVCVAPAIANALFTISGQRVRRLPLSAKPLP
ncbi:MAG: molybdopterin cofactor-binding domain-containing protein, partial [Sphingopyxis sp.]